MTEAAAIKGLDIRRGEPLSRYTSFGVGGKAEALCLPENTAQLVAALDWAREQDMPVAVLGGGCNVLVPDEGFAGLVVVMAKGFDQLSSRPVETGVEITAGSGLRLARLLKKAMAQGWQSLAFLAGVPGTVGGAAMMNAGAWGKTLGQVVRSLTLYGVDGRPLRLSRDELSYKYRRLEIESGLVVTEVVLESALAEPGRVEQEVNDWLERRRNSQPLNVPSAGSFFKNPAGDHAGRLIEAAGLKGFSVGGASVSEVHANFIINKERATAGDIITLAKEVHRRVKDSSGVELEPEVRLLGYGDSQWVRQ